MNDRLPVMPLSAAAPLRVDGASGGWLVENGEVDLFAAALDGGELGRRYSLCSFGSGELLLSLPGADDHAIIAVGRGGASVRLLGDADIAAVLRESGAALVETWFCRLAAAAFGERPPVPELAAEAGQQISLAPGQRLHAPHGAVWVVVRHGRLQLGNETEPLSRAIPIAAGMWLRADGDSVIDCLAAQEALGRRIGAAGIEFFHSVVSARLSERIAREEEDGRQRIAARSTIDERSIAMGVQQLAGVAGALPAPPTAPGIGADPAVSALAAVAAAGGLTLTRLPRFSGPVETALRGAARANGIGLRHVLLRGTWWRSDNGALLGWHGEAHRPVALLPEGRRAYRLWDPGNGKSQTIDDAIAGEIASQALMVYRPMPERVEGIASLARFAARGIGGDLVTVLAMGGLAGAIAVLLPLTTGYLFASAVPRAETRDVLAVVLGLVIAAFAAGAFQTTEAIAMLRLEGRLEGAMQPALMQRLFALPVNFFRSFGTGDLMNRVLSIQTIRRLLGYNTLVSLFSALFATVSFAVILFYSPLFAAVAAAVVGIAGAVSALLAILALRQERARVRLLGQEYGLLIQILQGIAKLRVAAAEARVFAVWAALFAQQKRRLLSVQRYAAFSEAFMDVYPILGLVTLFLAAALLLAPTGGRPSSLGLSTFLAVNAAFGQLFAATVSFAGSIATALELIPLFERLRPIVAATPEAQADKREAAALTGRIELSHISFRYTEGSGLILDDVSLCIEPGSLVALVGPSGSGKSTVLRLLLGFEAPESGDILFDGQPLGTLDAASLRRQIGVVLQHCALTTGSIFENLTSGLPYSLDDAWAAARLAGIAADIEAMPMGMHTLVMEGSPTLSGGQRQRLMIARALIGRPRVLLFDEATSALDNRSQALVMQSLDRLSATRIVVAHRLSTVEHADRIFVLERGRLVEQGTHAELIAGNGPFSRLARRQTL
jgi:NHLM bacteriocin system ABC transporter ATP-binding protein